MAQPVPKLRLGGARREVRVHGLVSETAFLSFEGAPLDWQGEPQPAEGAVSDRDTGAPSSAMSSLLITPRGTHALMDLVEVQTNAKLQRALLDGQRERDRADRLQLEVEMLRARCPAHITDTRAHTSVPPPSLRTQPLALVGAQRGAARTRRGCGEYAARGDGAGVGNVPPRARSRRG
jgi:hypothetical protein